MAKLENDTKYVDFNYKEGYEVVNWLGVQETIKEWQGGSEKENERLNGALRRAIASTCLHSFRNKNNLSFLLISTMQEIVLTRVSHLIMLSDRASEG